MGLGRDLRHARSLGLGEWIDLATAAAELAVARLRLARGDIGTLIGPGAAPAASGGPAHDRMVDRVAFAVPRMAARVPWRSTCLVQALAARRWLRRRGIASAIVLGARKGADEPLDAHAWLEAGGRVVVGGEVAGFARFTGSGAD